MGFSFCLFMIKSKVFLFLFLFLFLFFSFGNHICGRFEFGKGRGVDVLDNF